MKLTPTMEAGLRRMAYNMGKYNMAVMAEPNDNTGKALEKRGLVARANKPGDAWNRYTLTEAGKKWLEESPQ